MQVLKHVEGQDSLDDIKGPSDLAEGSRLIHDIMSSTNKVVVLDHEGRRMPHMSSPPLYRALRNSP